MRSTSQTLMAVLLGLALVAWSGCGDSSDDGETSSNAASNTTSSNSTGGTTGGTTSSNTSSTGGGGPCTSEPTGEAVDATRDGSCSAEYAYIAQVNGVVVDGDAASCVGAAKAQMCIRQVGGQLLCLRPEDTNGTGQFSIPVPENARCMSSATMRVLEPGATRSTMYCHIELPTDSTVLNVTETIPLFPTQPASDLPPEGDATAERTVTFPGGLEIDIVPDNLFDADYEDLAAGPVSEEGLCFVEGQGAVEQLYAFSPEGDVDGGGFKMRVPNSTGLAAGAKVDFHLLGGLSCTLSDGEAVEEGAWVQFDTGTVSGDGMFVETDNGIPCLTWFGYSPQ